MRGALVVSIGFVLQALGIVTFQWGLLSTLISFVGLVAVPVLLYMVPKRYFDTRVSGPIPYLSAAAFTFWTFILSLIVAALVYYMAYYYVLYYTEMPMLLKESMEQIAALVNDKQAAKEMMDGFSQMTPKSMTLSTCSTFFFLGTIYVYFIAIFLRRK